MEFYDTNIIDYSNLHNLTHDRMKIPDCAGEFVSFSLLPPSAFPCDSFVSKGTDPFVSCPKVGIQLSPKPRHQGCM